MNIEGRNIEAAEALELLQLVQYTDGGVASRVLSKTKGGNVTLFAFDAGQGLSEHSAPFDALVFVLEGRMRITIGGNPVETAQGQVVLMPADVPHALDALERARMLLVMLR